MPTVIRGRKGHASHTDIVGVALVEGSRAMTRHDRLGRTWTVMVLAVLLTGVLGGCGGDPGGGPGASGTPPTSPASTVATTTTVASAPATTSATTLREPHILVLSATGTATIESLTYTLDREQVTLRSVRPPWRETLTVQPDGAWHDWNLSVRHGAGNLRLVATFDGKVVAVGEGAVSGTGTGSANLSGRFRG